LNRKARTRLIVAVGVLGAVLVAALIWYAVSASAGYYHVGQLNGALNGKQVKLSGRVVPGSLTRGADGVHFALEEDRPMSGPLPTVNVAYSGQMPASFSGNSLAIIVGKYLSGTNTVAATTLQTKCPSKYEAQASSPSAQPTP